MATYSPEDLAPRELSCPICFEDYDIQDSRRAPKLLLCLHTFCFDCARKLWKNDGSLECSLCRMLHQEVKLDDLLDNHVIVQHLRQEFEMRDLEFAKRIDEEFRRQESNASPAAPKKVLHIIEPVVMEACSSPGIEVADIGTNQIETVEIADDTEEEEEEEEEDEDGQYVLSSFLDGIMRGLAQNGNHQAGEEPEDDDNDYEEPEEIEQEQEEEEEEEEQQQEQEEEEEESDTDPEEEEHANLFCSLHNIHALFGQESEEETRDENTNDLFIQHLDQTIYENEADEEEEDERWHSASDDLNVSCFEENDALGIQDMADDSADIFDWHIITSDNLFED